MDTLAAPVRVTFAPISALPDAAIPPGSRLRDMFLERGAVSFLDACHLVKTLPYGSNAASDDCLILFADGRGTCATKHGVIAKLAEELQLDVHKNLGFYRLDDEIVTGVNELLQQYGLAFVPQIHCFLEHAGKYVDLTEGNVTGKNKTIDVYDFIVRVPPESNRDEMQQLYADHLKRYAAIESRLGALPTSTVSALLSACGHLQMSRRLAQTAAV